MLKRSPLKHYFELRQRLIDNKDFLVQIASAKTEKSRARLLQSAASEQLNLLRDLLKNIPERNIDIDKTIYYQLESKKRVEDLNKVLKKFIKHPEIYRKDKNLRQFLKSSSKLLPYIIKTILKDGR